MGSLAAKAVRAVAAGVVLTGCIGATSRADFDAEVRARGGGLTTEWVDEALSLVAAEVGAPSTAAVEVLTMSISTASRAVTVQARRHDRRDFVDTITVVEGEVRGVRPVQDADDLPLDELVTPFGELPFDDIAGLGDRAIEAFDEPGAYVDTITVSIFDSEPRIVVVVESERRTGRVRFDTDGEIVEVDT